MTPRMTFRCVILKAFLRYPSQRSSEKYRVRESQPSGAVLCSVKVVVKVCKGKNRNKNPANYPSSFFQP